MSLFGIAAGLLGFGGIATIAGAVFAPGVVVPILRAGLAVAGRALGFALDHWQASLVVIAIGAALLFGFHEMGEARHQAKLADRYAGLYVDEQTAHEVTKNSLAGAQAQIEGNDRRIKAAAAELDREKKQAAADEARADERWRSTKVTVDALEADARDPKRLPCTVSEAARRALEGL